MKRKFSISIFLLATIGPALGQLVSSHAPTTAAPTMSSVPAQVVVGKPVARVNGAVLTDRDLLREEYTIFPYARQHNGGIPKAMEGDIRSGAMKMIVFEELAYQEAQRRRLTVPAAQVQRAEVAFRKQFANPQEYQDLLNTEFKGSKKLLQAKIERSLLIEQLLKLEVQDRSYVSVAEAKAFYDKNPERFRIPESYAVQTISVIPPNNASPEQVKEARRKAEDALRQAKLTKSYDEFGLLAEKISEDDYRVMMGDHQSVERAKLPPSVLQAVVNMKPGQVSDLVDIGNNGYTVVRLNGRTSAAQRKFEEVKESVRAFLKKQKAESLRSALDKRLRKNAKVEEL
ncbi:MAG TPA: peptidylprolyl isomerase [Candidatus Solibacter sp.]|nr:peptidylprolyl isomerase [Candidatus Solibacter sp.]